MKPLLYLFILVFALFLVSCEEKEGTIEVKNSVDNVQLVNITIDGNYITSSLLPGESGKRTFYKNNYNDISFPIKGVIEFYMIKGDKRVYLRTKESYRLDEGKTLYIDITNETEVESLQ